MMQSVGINGKQIIPLCFIGLMKKGTIKPQYRVKPRRMKRGRRRRARVSRIKKLDMSCSVLLFPPVINTRRLLHMDEKAGLGQDIDATERDESETGCREAKLID